MKSSKSYKLIIPEIRYLKLKDDHSFPIAMKLALGAAGRAGPRVTTVLEQLVACSPEEGSHSLQQHPPGSMPILNFSKCIPM